MSKSSIQSDTKVSNPPKFNGRRSVSEVSDASTHLLLPPPLNTTPSKTSVQSRPARIDEVLDISTPSGKTNFNSSTDSPKSIKQQSHENSKTSLNEKLSKTPQESNSELRPVSFL